MEAEKRARSTSSFHKQQCLSFVQKLWEADTLAMFHHPVSATDVPGYHDVVAEPMDLSTIRQKIEEERYSSDSEVEDDVALMLSNALDFNEKGTQWHALAKKLRKLYPTIAEQVGLSFDADQVFIPSKKVRDDESTLRKEEKKGGEKLSEVLEAMEKEKEIPLDELRLMYARRKAEAEQQSGSDRGVSSSAGDEEDGSEEEDEAESSDEEDSSASSSDSASESDEEDADE